MKRLKAHFRVFSIHRSHSAAGGPQLPPPNIVNRNGLDLTQATSMSLGSAFVGWAIPGSRGMCLTAVPTPAPNDHNPAGGSCSTTLAAAQSEGVSVTTTAANGQRYIVGLVPNNVSQVNLTSNAGAITHPRVTNNGFAAPIDQSGYRQLAIVAGGKPMVIGTNSP